MKAFKALVTLAVVDQAIGEVEDEVVALKTAPKVASASEGEATVLAKGRKIGSSK